MCYFNKIVKKIMSNQQKKLNKDDYILLELFFIELTKNILCNSNKISKGFHISLLKDKCYILTNSIGNDFLFLQGIAYMHEYLIYLKTNIDNFNFHFLEEKLIELSNKITKKCNYIDKKLHFIWIGEITLTHIDFILCWKKNNPDYETVLWVDSRIPSSKIINKFSHTDKENKRSMSNISKKINNSIYFFRKTIILKPVIKFKVNFNNISCHKINTPITLDKETSKMITIKKVHYLFYNSNVTLEKIYLFEAFIRVNLAAASDVLRYIILEQYGGIYVDIDTLPKIITYTEKTKKSFTKKINSDNILEVEMLNTQINNEAIILSKNIGYFKNSIVNDSADFFLEKIKKEVLNNTKIGCYPYFLPLNEMKLKCCDFKISKDKIRSNVYFSNLIYSKKGSKFIILTIKNLIYNYNELGIINEGNKKNKCIRKYFKEFFLDGVKNNSRLTLKVSGPGVIIKSALTNITEILQLPDDFNNNSLLFMLNTFWSTDEYSLYNYESNNSTWSKWTDSK